MRPAEKPLAVVLFLKDEYTCIILHPTLPFPVRNFEWFKGAYESLGYLEDNGYKFSKLKYVIPKIPKWVKKKVPSQYNIWGYATINSFPIK